MALGLFVTPRRFLISSWAPQFHEDPEHHALSATPSVPPSLEPRSEGGLKIRDVLDCGCDVMTCCFNDEGTLLAVGLTNGTIQVYQPADGTFLYQLNSSETLQSSLPVTSLRFQHRDNRERHCLLLATYASGCVRVWHNPHKPTPVHTTTCLGHDRTLFSPPPLTVPTPSAGRVKRGRDSAPPSKNSVATAVTVEVASHCGHR
ncbi:uncharacterized protein LOC121306785 [Polyodon spathula]|uniref:uncharacterized protein LOC121306785 n=1 Tax=Polyodon spathula TaxID=7913 RepID=UPI001B7F26FF|nr:uncharacterized protein LOC121306785 [Polyodon spathula]